MPLTLMLVLDVSESVAGEPLAQLRSAIDAAAVDALPHQEGRQRRIVERRGPGRLDRDRGGMRRARIKSRYVLMYTPSAVEAGGWHAIDVRLTRQAATVRRGYLRGTR